MLQGRQLGFHLADVLLQLLDHLVDGHSVGGAQLFCQHAEALLEHLALIVEVHLVIHLVERWVNQTNLCWNRAMPVAIHHLPSVLRVNHSRPFIVHTGP